MSINSIKKIFFVLLLFSVSCKKNDNSEASKTPSGQNAIAYAHSLAIYKQKGYSIVKIINPWPNSDKDFTYILKEKKGIIPDSLQKYPTIEVPLHSIVTTSTTTIPYLEMLGVEKSLVGFPHTDYISSKKTRALIDNGAVKNVGQNERLDIEKLIDLNPNLIVAFGVDNNNPMLDNLKKSGLAVLIQADWMEQSPLGKAEWIKLYGALFAKEKEAQKLFNQIATNYNDALALVSSQQNKATVLYGYMYQNQWFVARGNSWIAQFIKDAKANYLWSDLKGTGSQAFSFERILIKGKKATFWITSGLFKTVADFGKSNPHYSQFDAFKTKNIYTFEGKTGATGGTLFYELSPSRPDLVLKDYIKIFHPELLPNYTLTFAQKLN